MGGMAPREKSIQTVPEHEWDEASLEAVLRETGFVWMSQAPCAIEEMLF